MTFQVQAYGRQAPAAEGDFVSGNPYSLFPAGAGALVAGASGVTVGRFAWIANKAQDFDSGPAIAQNFSDGIFTPVAGFVHREQQALITTYLAESGMVVPQGFAVTLLTSGDIWVKNTGTGFVTPGQKLFAGYADGKATFAATAATPTTAGSGSSSSVAASTSSVTGSISGNVLTVTAVGSGTVYPGTTISGTGVATGTMVASQLSGTAAGIGTYAVNIGGQTVAPTTISGTYGTLTVGGTVVSGFGVGQLLSGSGVAAGTYVTALITGAGGAGTYAVSNNTVVSSTAITAYANIETKWFAVSGGAAGELIRCSSQALG